jgi:hypothetical protein
MRISGNGKVMSIPAAVAVNRLERIRAVFSLMRVVKGPEINAPTAIVYKPNERRPATKAVEYPSDNKYKLKIA